MASRPNPTDSARSVAPAPVPPPPPRPPAPVITIADTNNSIRTELGPEHNLSLGEGIYKLRDEILLGAVPPHPSDPPPTNVHVLDPKPGPLTSGVKLSLAVIAPRKTSPRIRRINTGQSTKSSSDSHTTSESQDDSVASSRENGSDGQPTTAWVLGDDNPALAVPVKNAKDKDKKRKPTSSMAKSSSSFISRVTPHDVPTKRLAEHDPAGIYAFANTNRAFYWFDFTASNKPVNGGNPIGGMIAEPKIDALSKILFTKAFALCHDVNRVTLTATHCDVIIGFNHSDFIWWDPPTQKYNRLNKNGTITPSPPLDVKWVPGSENLFVAAHRDGSIIVYDKEKEDAAFVPEDEPSAQSTRRPRMLVRKSIHSKNQKTNPAAFYKVSKESVNNIAFSPSGQHLAAVCEDGTLRVIDLTSEQLIDLQSSYCGGFTCVTWSPDGLYLLTGGQDDTLSLWSVLDRALVARCVGHRSWIAGLAFDPWRCDDQGNYRFASVGDDCRLLFWDFGVGMLSRPRAASVRHSISSFAPSRSQSSTTVQRVGAVNGLAAPAPGLRQAQPEGSRFASQVDLDPAAEIAHAAAPKNSCARLPPVLARDLDPHPLSWVGFEDDCVVVACKAGHIRTYDRPAVGGADEAAGLGAGGEGGGGVAATAIAQARARGHRSGRGGGVAGGSGGGGSLSFANPFLK